VQNHPVWENLTVLCNGGQIRKLADGELLYEKNISSEALKQLLELSQTLEIPVEFSVNGTLYLTEASYRQQQGQPHLDFHIHTILKNHGKIIRTTVLNARRFAQYLQQHSNCTFRYIDEKLQQESDSLKACNVPFKIELLYNNIDTNLVCFFVRPCRWVSQSGNRRWKMEPDDTWTLEEINNLNRRIHERMTISRSREADLRKNTLNQKFYVAGTNLETNKYSAESMSVSLKRFGFQPDEYAANGLYVMRSTIMNPWYYKAAQSANHIDYFMEFLEELHYATRKVLDASSEEHNNNQ
jgi:hypothetical protein